MKNLTSPETWNTLNQGEFEDLVFWILHREGFFNVAWREGTDGEERDGISCRRTNLVSLRVDMQEYVVACKMYDDKVPRKELRSIIEGSVRSEPDFFVFATSGLVDEATKRWCTSLELDPQPQVVVWERADLAKLLETHQDLRLQLFEIPPSASFFVRHLTEREQQFIDFEQFFKGPIVRGSFEQACQIAIDQSSLVTLAHLLIALIRLDEVCTCDILRKQGLEPADIAAYLTSLVNRNQNKTDIKTASLKLSASFRSVLDTAIVITRLFDDQILTERILLLAILMHPTSVSVSALNQLCSNEEPAVLNALLKRHFSAKERELLLGTFGPELKALGVEEIRDLWDKFGTPGKVNGMEETMIISLSDLQGLREKS